MNTALLIYLVMQLDTAVTMIIIALIVSILVMLVSALVYAVYHDEKFSGFDRTRITAEENCQKSKTIGKRSFYSAIVLSCLVVFVPSTKTAIYMIGGSGVVEVLQSEQAQEVGGKAYRLLMKKLDEELAE